MAGVVQRSAIGLCLIAFICGLLSADSASGHGWGVIVLVTLLVAAGLREMVLILRGGDPLPGGLLVAGGAAFVLLRGVAYELDERLHLLEAPLAIACAYAAWFGALRGAPALPRLRGQMAAVFAFFYLPVLGGYALDVRFLSPDLGPAAFFFLISIAKGTDICAYFGGKAFGRVKIVPSVSPGKTTAGFVGALVGGVLITGLFTRFSAVGHVVAPALVPGVGVLLALVVISGDLIESFIKRSVAVKDSASLLPGFGGVLDVVDSVVIAAPVVYYLLRGLSALGEVSA